MNDPHDSVGVDWAKAPTHRPPEQYPEEWQQKIYDMPTKRRSTSGATIVWCILGGFIFWVLFISWVASKYL